MYKHPVEALPEHCSHYFNIAYIYVHCTTSRKVAGLISNNVIEIFIDIVQVLFFINVYIVLFLFNNVIYVFLLLCLCILIVCLCMTTLTEVFPCFFLSCTANARVKPANTGHGPHSSKFLCCSMYCFVSYSALSACICVLYYCHRVAKYCS
jgi:hypothetical protein